MALDGLEPETPVFLTGATGFIGRRLATRMVAAGAQVSALVLAGEESLLPDGVRAFNQGSEMPYGGFDRLVDVFTVKRLAGCCENTDLVNTGGNGAIEPFFVWYEG